MEGIRKRGRSRKLWTDEAEEDMMIMGIKNVGTVNRDWKEWRRNLLEAKVHKGLYCMKRRRRRRSIDHKLVSSPARRLPTV